MVLRERESRSPPVFIFEPLFLSNDRKRGFCVFSGFIFKSILDLEMRFFGEKIDLKLSKILTL